MPVGIAKFQSCNNNEPCSKSSPIKIYICKNDKTMESNIIKLWTSRPLWNDYHNQKVEVCWVSENVGYTVRKLNRKYLKKQFPFNFVKLPGM